MARWAPNNLGRVTAALLALCLLAPVASPAVASPTPPPPPPENAAAVATKLAERDAALAELEASRADLSARVAEYVALGRRIHRAQAEMIAVEAELAEVNADLILRERAVTERVVQMYRSDRIGLLGALLDSRSLQDLMVRARYLVKINERDSRMLAELRLARTESMWLQQNLADRVEALRALQDDADARRETIEADMEAQQVRAQELGEQIAKLMRPKPKPRPAVSGVSPEGATPSGEFDPFTIVTDAVFRDSKSMTEADIQTFLDRQPGTLGSYRARDHNGEMKSAARMIAEAAVAHNVNPKIILVKLQKEQSLLARPNPTQVAYDWAMGCGKTDSKTLTKYQGFGKQIWYGAMTLDKNAGRWKPGVTLTITGEQITPTNASTYSLYKYTPHLAGNMSFWMLYWRYFGDPLGG